MKIISIQLKKDPPAELAQCAAWFGLLTSPLLLIAIGAKDTRTIFHLLLFFIGWCCWTFTEYCMHRFKDHGGQYQQGEKPEKLHHYHHRHPTEIAISSFHRVSLLILCAIFVVVAIWLDGYFTLLPGFVVGFTGYTFTHWFLHHKLSARIFPELHRFHIHHHCKHPDKCFGITITWWDHLFGTVPEKSKEISDRILAFYYKKEKKPPEKIISLSNMIDEKISFTDNQSA